MIGDLRLWDVLTGIVIVAIIYSLVRPGSAAGTAVADISAALIAVVGAATGYQASTGSTGSNDNPQA
jgi:hypothetical protein